MSIDKSRISGSTAILILRLLKEKDMYGYEMIDTLRHRSRNGFELKAGTLYPLLHSLENKGLLDSYESAETGKLRKYYQITKDGSQYLKDKKQEWQVYAQAVADVLSAAGLHALNPC